MVDAAASAAVRVCVCVCAVLAVASSLEAALVVAWHRIWLERALLQQGIPPFLKIAHKHTDTHT